jgi:hypothetical protein
MLASLLPAALIVMLVMALALVILLKTYTTARPGSALVVSRSRGDVRVLLSGGLFVARSATKVESLDMTERRLTFSFDDADPLAFSDGELACDVVVVLAPEANERGVLSVARSVGVPIANDAAALKSHLDRPIRSAIVSAAAGLPRAEAGTAPVEGRLREAVAGQVAGFRVEGCTLTPRP